MSEKLQALEAQLAQAATQREKIDTLNLMAREVQRTNVSYAQELAQQAHTLSQQEEFQAEPYCEGMIAALVMLSNTSDLQNNLQEALKQVYEALTLCDLLTDQRLRLSVLNRLAWAHFRLGSYSKALEYAFQLLTLAEKLSDLEHQAHSYNVLGAIYGDLGDEEKSIAYLQLALPLFQTLGNLERERAVLGNFCMAYRLFGQHAKALENGLRALQMSFAAGDLQHQANFLAIIGDVYYELQEDATALDYYRQGLAVSHTHGFTRNVNRLHLGLGRVHFRQQHYAQALEQHQLALAMAQQADYKYLIYQVHEELSKVYEQQGAFQQALYHYQQFHQIRDTVLSQEQAIKLQNLRTTYEIEQAQREAETQRRLREEEQRYYEQLSKMKDELIGTASHDLKSPLTSIMIGIDLLRRHQRLDDEAGQNLIQRLDTNAERMRELISDLLDLAKLETGQGLHMEQVALKPFLEGVIETLKPLAQKQGITLELQPDFQDVLIQGDTSGLRRVLDNLLSNAIKYTQAGGRVTVYAELVGAEIIVKVKDTGIGIPSKDIPHVFERFYRVADKAHQAVEGTGLGLAIVKSIIEQHGGKIWVESQPGISSTFSFSVPRVEAPAIA